MAKVAVIGAGLMGSGIAQSLAMGGKRVALYDSSKESLKKAQASIEESLQRFVKAGTMDADVVFTVMEHIRPAQDVWSAVKDADLVIEAVPEALSLKKLVFEELDRLAPPEAILATNTSELSVTAIAAATSRPEKVLGMHWFNPAPVMKLIELVQGEDTSPETIGLVKEFSHEIGKETVVVKDRQGFVTTRAIAAHMLECMRMYEENIAEARDIDKAIRLGLNYPMGPLELADLVGLDTMLFVSEGMASAYGDRFLPPQILRKLVEAGHYGRKTGRGFYHYTEQRETSKQ
ncbi:3-hydroxyacyl-CoA dehydrogenase family protein [Bacillus sp. FJAT-42376]|uniref:3-hydroxyacyl-CoA dehydrogenase family protein n=1 Tax=Bacillus sp. FJAT-42376 TaxID=2014076 RepID=UPI000F4E0758|nr:3-hydroxyacyl-CoA dehydrogenase family protein [Bacillus sp. FJAT-42376]AZB44780.1 3-hydroxyacyl-CoA dehydrogenase family protein [Bacillus sp. FJAT-42376]